MVKKVKKKEGVKEKSIFEKSFVYDIWTIFTSMKRVHPEEQPLVRDKKEEDAYIASAQQKALTNRGRKGKLSLFHRSAFQPSFRNLNVCFALCVNMIVIIIQPFERPATPPPRMKTPVKPVFPEKVKPERFTKDKRLILQKDESLRIDDKVFFFFFFSIVL
jgi:hypothetical protein